MNKNENTERMLSEDAQILNLCADETSAADPAEESVPSADNTDETLPAEEPVPSAAETEKKKEDISTGVTVAQALDDIDREVASLERTAQIFRARKSDGTSAGKVYANDDYIPISNIFSERREKDPERKSDITFVGPDGAKASLKFENDRDGSLRRFFNELIITKARESRQRKDNVYAKPAPKAKKKKKGSSFFHLAAGLLLIGLIAYYILFADGLRAVTSIRELEVNSNAYSMTYTGDYDLGKFLLLGGASTDEEIMEYLSDYYSRGFIDMPTVASRSDVSTDGVLTVLNSEYDDHQALTGRNYNCEGELMSMVVITRRSDGRESVSTVDLSRLGYTPYNRPGVFRGYGALASVFFPLDGMNDRGLCVAAVELPGEPEPVEDTARTDLTVTAAVRVLLDRAGNVEDAVELLGRYDIFPSFGHSYHLLLSDREGNSVVIEWKNGQMYSLKSNYATNERMYNPGTSSGASVIETETGRISDLLAGSYSRYDGHMTLSQVSGVMRHAALSGDGWRVVFDAKKTIACYEFEADADRQVIVSMSPS